MRAARLAAAVLAVAVLIALAWKLVYPGAPDRLDSDDDRALFDARGGIDDALDTEETIRTSPEMARRLARRVQRAFEHDELQPLEDLVPSLVVDGQVDSRAASAFQRYAESDAPRALLIPAQRNVEAMIDVIDDSGADGETEVPHARDTPLERYLAEVDRDIREVWPALAQELEDAL